MKTLPILAILLPCLGGIAFAVEPAPLSLDSLDRDLHALVLRLDDAESRLADLQSRLDAIEKRLGESHRFATPFDTIERRLEDLEEAVDRLNR